MYEHLIRRLGIGSFLKLADLVMWLISSGGTQKLDIDIRTVLPYYKVVKMRETKTKRAEFSLRMLAKQKSRNLKPFTVYESHHIFSQKQSVP